MKRRYDSIASPEVPTGGKKRKIVHQYDVFRIGRVSEKPTFTYAELVDVINTRESIIQSRCTQRYTCSYIS